MGEQPRHQNKLVWLPSTDHLQWLSFSLDGVE